MDRDTALAVFDQVVELQLDVDLEYRKYVQQYSISVREARVDHAAIAAISKLASERGGSVNLDNGRLNIT